MIKIRKTNKLLLSVVVVFMIFMSGCSPTAMIATQGEETQEDHLHEHSVEIEGKDMRMLTIQEIADLWEIDATTLKQAIITEFDFVGNYTEETVLETMRIEYKFSPAIIKDIAEEIKEKNQD